MSLPTKAIYYYKEKEVAYCSCNIGWVYREDFVPRLFHDMACNDSWWEYTDEWEKCGKHWDKVKLYGKTYTKEDVKKMIKEGTL